MAAYRVYLSRPTGEVEQLVSMPFEDDQHAITYGMGVDRGDRSLEIWCDLRLVTMLAPIETSRRLRLVETVRSQG